MAIRKRDTVETAFQAEAFRLTQWRPSDPEPERGFYEYSPASTSDSQVHQSAMNILRVHYERQTGHTMDSLSFEKYAWALMAVKEALTKGMP